MKLPIPFLLYVTALLLVGHAAWNIVEIVPMRAQQEVEKVNREGREDSKAKVKQGQSRGAKVSTWSYGRDAEPWWANLKAVNWTGKLPPPPPKSPEQIAAEQKPVVVVDDRPLDQMIELVSLVYDGQFEGKGGNSHVIVRFKPEANVQPPDWWVKENVAPPAGAGTPVRPVQTPRDTAPGRGGRGGGQRPATPPTASPSPAPATPMPGAGGIAGREVLQKIWAQDAGDPRRSPQLWPVKSNDGKALGAIRLVRVAPDAQSAFFARVAPEVAGQPTAPPREEELIKTVADLSQDILRELRLLQGRERKPAADSAAGLARAIDGAPPKWVDVEETTRDGNRFNIGRKDEQRWREGSDDLMDQITVDTYVSKSGTTGLIVKAADQQLAGSFGVAPGDVLIEVNGRKVESKAQTVAIVKDDYKRGVRSFVTKWMSNGQILERTYTAPDR